MGSALSCPGSIHRHPIQMFSPENRSTRLDSLLQHLPQAQNATAPLSERIALLSAVVSTLGIPVRELAAHLIRAVALQEVRTASVSCCLLIWWGHTLQMG